MPGTTLQAFELVRSSTSILDSMTPNLDTKDYVWTALQHMAGCLVDDSR
jgi:hypothetical protein